MSGDETNNDISVEEPKINGGILTLMLLVLAAAIGGIAVAAVLR